MLNYEKYLKDRAGRKAGQGLIIMDQLVSTGTCIEPLPIEPGNQIQADFGILG